jgi:hypothetical protein
MAICDSSGNVLASYLHTGGVLLESEITATALFVPTNLTRKVEGYWQKDSQNVSLIVESTTEKTSKFFFNSVNNAFSKTGEYVLKLSFFSSRTDYSETDVSVRIFCPGMDCSGDSNCNSDEQCSEGKCTALKCKYGEYVEFNSCMPICNDHNPCTEDVYSNGHCLYKQTGSCCISDDDCNDHQACTAESCVNNKCSYSPVKCEAATDKCVVSKCIEPRGCVYETDEQCLGVETNKREYFITIGTPTVQKKSILVSFAEWIDNLFKNLF